MKTRGTVRRVWGPERGVYSVIFRQQEPRPTIVLWTRDKWLAALCERYSERRPRTTLKLQWDPETREVKAPVLPVAEEQSA